MKKTIYLSVLLLVLTAFSAQRSYAQHITTHYFSDSCGTGGMFYVNISGSVSGLKMETSYGDGTKDTVIVYSSYAYPSHHYTSTGTYTVKFVLFTTSGRLDSLSYSQLIMGCHFITAKIYDDVNSNCSFDAGDHIMYFPCQVQVDSGGGPIDTICAYGDMIYRAYSLSATYKFTPINLPATVTMACPSVGYLSSSASSGGPVHAGDFGFHCSTSTSFDMVVHTSNRPGRHSMRCMAIVVNNSCTPKSGSFTMTMDSKYTYYSSYPSGGSVSGNTVTWSYSNVSIDSPVFFEIWGETSPWLTPGTATTTSAYITHVTGDGNSANDTAVTSDTVSASWDPNDKTVSPSGAIKAGTKLTYTLSFENTGNAPALNIYILDTLAPSLDVQSLQVIGSSHKMSLNKLALPDGRTILRFDFANINLLDSSHHGQADGFVTFSINANHGLPLGTVINNIASIYFDDNEPVRTNTAYNIISNVGVTGPAPVSNYDIYPNPVNNDLIIKANPVQFNNITIMNAMGQTVQQQKIQSAETHVNTQSLTPGLYYIVLKGADGMKVEKIEKL